MSTQLSEKNRAIREKLAAMKAKIAAAQAEEIVEPEPEKNFRPEVEVQMENVIGTEYEQFKVKLAELGQALDEEIPGFATLLRDIHKELSADPNIVTILEPDEIGIITKGLMKHMDITVISAKTKTKRTQPITADDL